jgi:hypothetical protein
MRLDMVSQPDLWESGRKYLDQMREEIRNAKERKERNEAGKLGGKAS